MKVFSIEVIPVRQRSVLDEALALVRGTRGRAYGAPVDNHGATAAMFAAYVQRKHGVAVPIDAEDVCWFNVFQKASRDAHQPGRDNLVDVAGYVENIDSIRKVAAA